MAQENNVNEYERRVKLMAAKGSASCDYTLPDYLGDVKKILKYRADVVPVDKYSGSREVSFLYQVNYSVTYLDSQDALTNASFSGEFEHTEKLDGECIDVYSDTKLEGLTIRLQGPRKICAKAQMTTDVCIIESLPLPVLEASSPCEKNLFYANVYTPEYVECAEREFAERIASLADVSCDEAEVIKESAYALVESVSYEGGSINVKGSVFASALIRSKDSVIRVEKKLPFEESVARDTLSEGAASYFAKAFITDVKVTLNNEMGDDGSGACYCSAVMGYSLKCLLRINKNCEYELARDAFAPGKKNFGEYVDFSYEEYIADVNERRKNASEIERPCPPIKEIMECDAEIKGIKCASEGEEALITAEICYSAIASLADGSGYVPVKHTARVEEKVKLCGMDSDCRIDCSVGAYDVSISFDNEKLYPSSVLYINVAAVKPHKDKVISRLASEDCEAQSAPSLTVYYPTAGDTLWSVSKAHSVAPGELISLNSFASAKIEDSVADMKYILISE